MWIVGSFIAGKLLLNRSPKQIINFSLTFILVGGLAMALAPQATPFWSFFVIAWHLRNWFWDHDYHDYGNGTKSGTKGGCRCSNVAEYAVSNVRSNTDDLRFGIIMNVKMASGVADIRAPTLR